MGKEISSVEKGDMTIVPGGQLSAGANAREVGRRAGRWDEFKNADTWRAVGAELIATLLFVFLGAGTVIVTGQLAGDSLTPARLMTIALAHGLAIILLVSATANISGGHINPAVTFAAVLSGNISIPKGATYVAAQIIGAILGALLIAGVIPGAIDGTLGSHGLAANMNEASGLLAEAIFTFVLVFVVFATAMDPRGLKQIAPLAIGLAVLVDHLIGVPLTGASMNPARSFGPALVSGTWDAHWLYWAGPLLGGGLAALTYKFLFLTGRKAGPAPVSGELSLDADSVPTSPAPGEVDVFRGLPDEQIEGLAASAERSRVPAEEVAGNGDGLRAG